MGVSLRAVVLVIVVIVAAASAITIFFPINTATGDAVDDLVTQLRASTSRNLVQLTAAQFDPTRSLAFALVQQFRLGALDPNDGTNLASFIPTFCALATSTPYLALMGAPNEDFAGCGNDGQAVYREPKDGNYYYAQTTLPYRQLNKSRYVLNTRNFKVTARAWFHDLKNRTGGGWSSFYIRAGTPSTVSSLVGYPLYNPRDGSFVAVVGVSVWSLNLMKALSSSTIGQTGRAMVYDGTTGYFVAGNFNQSSVIETASTGKRLAWVNDTTESLIVAAIRGVGGQDALLRLPQSYAGSIPYGDGDTAYLDVAAITDSIGLNLRVLTVIRRSDFTGSIDQQRDVAIGIAVAVVGVLAMLSAGVVWWITAPLADVAESMNIENSLGVEIPTAHAQLSSLSEIQAIQVAFRQLCAELKRLRSYLPESILRRLDADADDEDDEELSQSRTVSVSRSRRDDGTRSLDAKFKSGSRVDHDSSSQRSQSSDRGGGGTAAGSGTGIAAIEAALSLTTRRISVVALNLRGTHGHVSSRGETALSELCGRYLDIVLEAAKGARGVVQLMHGDRVFIGFNTSVRVASHAAMAVEVAEKVRKRVQCEMNMEVTAGVASGDAVVGLLGNTAKQFSVVGRPFVHAAVLERLCLCESLLCKQCDGVDGKFGRRLNLLVDRATLSSAGFTIAMRAVDIVALPQAPRPQVVATLLSEAEMGAMNDDGADGDDGDMPTPPAMPNSEGTPHSVAVTAKKMKSRVSVGDREWMYELSRAIECNIFSSYTEAMDGFAEGNGAAAVAKLLGVTAAVLQPLVRATQARFAHLTAAGHPNMVSLASELGPYYSGVAA